VGFTVRTEETGSAMDILGGLTSFSQASSSDTDILYKFIQSQELVRNVDKALNLRAIYQKPTLDPVFRLDDSAPIEDLVDYWKRMVRIFYDPSTGLMEIEVRAFDPVDAQDIAQDLFDRSSAMINALSAVARNDTSRYAKEELDDAVERLKQARQALTLFRNDKQIVDPTADIQGQMGLLNSLHAQLATSLIELDLLADTTRDTDPRVEQAKRKIVVINTRIDAERQKLGVGGGRGGGAFADLVGQFESLQVDREFAEKAYVSALSAYDSSLAEARRQSRYLAAYVQPTLAETPLYPQRAILLLIAGLLIFGTWAIGVLVFYSLKDRR
jgi:capsular polysaccharide transport system permease protein